MILTLHHTSGNKGISIAKFKVDLSIFDTENACLKQPCLVKFNLEKKSLKLLLPVNKSMEDKI